MRTNITLWTPSIYDTPADHLLSGSQEHAVTPLREITRSEEAEDGTVTVSLRRYPERCSADGAPYGTDNIKLTHVRGAVVDHDQTAQRISIACGCTYACAVELAEEIAKG